MHVPVAFITYHTHFDVLLQVMTILLRMDDKMNRQLTCEILKEEEDAHMLAEELVHFGFINAVSITKSCSQPC
jgi:hypothetical protein